MKNDWKIVGACANVAAAAAAALVEISTLLATVAAVAMPKLLRLMCVSCLRYPFLSPSLSLFSLQSANLWQLYSNLMCRTKSHFGHDAPKQTERGENEAQSTTIQWAWRAESCCKGFSKVIIVFKRRSTFLWQKLKSAVIDLRGYNIT